jgi:hypothetical protein
MERTNFILAYKYNDIFNDLSDKQAGVLIKAIFKYQFNGAIASFNDNELKMAFKFIKKDMDYNNHKYQQICEKNRGNGLKGGRPKLAQVPLNAEKKGEKSILNNEKNGGENNPNCKKNRTVISETVGLLKNPLINKDNFEQGSKPFLKKTERLFEKPKKPDNDNDDDDDYDNDDDYDYDYDKDKDKDKDCVSALLKHYPPKNFSGKSLPKSQTELPALKAPPALAANKQQAPTKKLYANQANEINSTPTKTAQKALAPNGRQATIKTLNPQLNPQAKIFEIFKEIYERETGQPYAQKQSEFILLATLIKLHGIDAVMLKIKILSAGCKNTVFWFTKGGFSDFSIGKLSSMWNNLVPIETEEQKQARIERLKTIAAANRVYEEREKERKQWELTHTKITTKL